MIKNYFCVFAIVALFAACEQKTETVAPATSPTAEPESTTSTTTTTTTEMPSPTPTASAPSGTLLNPGTSPSP